MTPDTTAEDKETGRVEAFSDGVFAFAITVLVLDLKVPRDAQSSAELVRKLAEEWPAYVAYLVSFGTIGIMWLNHHNLFTLIRRVDHGLLVSNTLLLLGVTIVPFTTALVAETMVHQGGRVGAVVYSGAFVYIAVLYNVLWRNASDPRDSLLAVPHDDPRVLAVHAAYRLGPIYYVVALAASYFNAVFGVVIDAALALYFALPPRQPAK